MSCAQTAKDVEGVYVSLVPSPPPQLSSLAVRITWRVIHTASDDSCGGGLGTRLGLVTIERFLGCAESAVLILNNPMK